MEEAKRAKQESENHQDLRHSFHWIGKFYSIAGYSIFCHWDFNFTANVYRFQMSIICLLDYGWLVSLLALKPQNLSIP